MMSVLNHILFVSLVTLVSFSASGQLYLKPFISNVTKVTDITHCGDDRLFIVEQAGKIKISDLSGNLNTAPFLSITGKVNDSGGEQGLLGLAFSPDYKNDRRFYVNYINNSGNTVISRLTALQGNPDLADSVNEEILFTVSQPFSNHNGGGMQFGSDGFLYISLGDGGSAGDPLNNAQSLQVRLGKLLRLDVNVPVGYKIPPTNPFVGVAGTDSLIWAYGLRNAWRFSFDKLTHDLWIADVGQNLWEEINFVPSSSSGGQNFGWRCYEGDVTYNTVGCPDPDSLVFPVHVYGHFPACSVTGGYVYRGGRFGNWFGRYFFTDYCSGVIQSLAPNDSGGFDLISYGTFTPFAFTTFGQDKYGELYIGKGTSGVLKLADSSCTPVAYISEKDTIVHHASSLKLETPLVIGFSYQWYFNEMPIPGANGNSYTATQSGSYKVNVVSDSGCVAFSDPVMIFLRMNNPFVIYPNPAGESAEINWSDNFPGTKRLEVFDIAGRLCETVTLGKEAFSYRLYTHQYANGLYILRLTYNDESFQEKFMVR